MLNLNLLFDFLFLVEQTPQLPQIQQKLFIHFGVIVLRSRVLIGVRPVGHYRLRTVEKVQEIQILKFSFGRLESNASNKNDGGILSGQFIRQQKVLTNIVHHTSRHLFNHLENPLDIIKLATTRLQTNPRLFGDLIQILSIPWRKFFTENLTGNIIVKRIVFLDQKMSTLRFELKRWLLGEFGWHIEKSFE